MATAAILGLAPLYRAGLVNDTLPLVVEAKVGSSAAGATPGPGSHHPDRSGAVRSFQPTGHRHTAELIQELGRASGGELHQHVAFSATAVELVRGVLVTAHPFLNENVDERTLWRLSCASHQHQPLITLVQKRDGGYRYPEPEI